MTHQAMDELEIHQCLFGYDSGHRLLASSTNLPSDAMSLLLLLSDLAPGVGSERSQGYWTGFHLPKAKLYALLKTWPAPEMSRPGCVWTHTLLISIPDLARITDLSVLELLVRRPGKDRNFESYQESILVQLSEIQAPSREVASEVALQLLREVYSNRGTITTYAHDPLIEDAVFALWSQQWPRLRRNFSFQTALSSHERPLGSFKFDLRFTTKERSRPISPNLSSPTEPWESACLDDLLSPRTTELRRFLWRYGSDIRKGRERFRGLVDLYLCTSGQDVEQSCNTKQVLEILSRYHFGDDEANLLKEDLFSADERKFSLVKPLDPCDSFDFLARRPNLETDSNDWEKLDLLFDAAWRREPGRTIRTAATLIRDVPAVATNVYGLMARQLSSESFVHQTAEIPFIRVELLKHNPELVYAIGKDSEFDLQLVETLSVSPDSADLVESIVERLLYTSDPIVAERTVTLFPLIAMHAVARTMARAPLSIPRNTSKSWIRSVSIRKNEFLAQQYIEQSSRFSTLLGFAEALGYDSREVLLAGPQSWATGVSRSIDDLPSHEQSLFFAFLMALAVNAPKTGSEVLMEITFNHLHHALWWSRLSYQAEDMLMRHVPVLGWLDNWDKCLRLRIAVTTTYINEELDPESFCRLTSDPHVFAKLLYTAEQTSAGRRYIRTVRRIRRY